MYPVLIHPVGSFVWNEFLCMNCNVSILVPLKSRSLLLTSAGGEKKNGPKSPKSPDEQRRVNSQQGVKKQDEQTVSKCPTGKKPFTEMTALSKGMS